jgi:Fic family protein
MTWNWQLPDWPNFKYNKELIRSTEKEFLLRVGGSAAFLKKVEKNEYDQFLVEILSQEGFESSKIEGELLDRERLQSSIKKNFGLTTANIKENKKEKGMAELLHDVYQTYADELNHEMLWRWHSILFKGNNKFEEVGQYRTQSEPMQIVSGRYDRQRVYFVAPPSDSVYEEMEIFIKWCNSSKNTEMVLGRAAIAHVYFESIHPFEDGNGRIGRILVEKILSQELGRPALIAISQTLEKNKKEYYTQLEGCNKSLEASRWVEFFAKAVLESEKNAMKLLNFLMEKSRIFETLRDKINPRQEKVLLKLFESGPEGFVGGFSSEKYISITKTSRATATRDLSELVELNILTKTGKLRQTRYWLNIKIT